MFGLTGLAARIAGAVLYGVLTWAVIFIIGLVVSKFPTVGDVGQFIERVAPLIGLLVGLYWFFAGYRHFPHTSA